jgi:hypothetical protein
VLFIGSAFIALIAVLTVSSMRDVRDLVIRPAPPKRVTLAVAVSFSCLAASAILSSFLGLQSEIPISPGLFFTYLLRVGGFVSGFYGLTWLAIERVYRRDHGIQPPPDGRERRNGDPGRRCTD